MFNLIYVFVFVDDIDVNFDELIISLFIVGKIRKEKFVNRLRKSFKGIYII